jgi:RNA polymerase sigma factor (sigma-70 family)
VALLSANTNSHKGGVDIAAKIFGEYGDFIHAVIRCKVRDKVQADDLSQDFFLSLVSRPPPPDIQNVKGYLYRAIINDIVDGTRRIERYQIHIRRYAERVKYFRTEDSPENDLIEAEEMDKMFKLIERQLPRTEAQAIILRYRNHYKIKEVAAKMGINDNITWRYIYKGLRKIRQFLTKR